MTTCDYLLTPLLQEKRKGTGKFYFYLIKKTKAALIVIEQKIYCHWYEKRTKLFQFKKLHIKLVFDTATSPSLPAVELQPTTSSFV